MLAGIHTRTLFFGCSFPHPPTNLLSLTFAKFVLFPTPLTPKNTIEYTLFADFAARAARKTSIDFLGVKRVMMATVSASFTFLSVKKSDTKVHSPTKTTFSTLTFANFCSLPSPSAPWPQDKVEPSPLAFPHFVRAPPRPQNKNKCEVGHSSLKVWRKLLSD